MKDCIGIYQGNFFQRPLRTWIEQRCAEAGVRVTWKHVHPGNRSEYGPSFMSSPNVITWSFKMPWSWMTCRGQNVLFLENSLINQAAGAFIDHRGFFADSNLCQKRTWEQSHAIDVESMAKEWFGWEFGSGGTPEGPLLAALQMRRDASLRQYFPLGDKFADKTVGTLALLRDHLPRGRRILIRPHPRERAMFLNDLNTATGGCWRDDWTLDCENTLAERLPQCSALVTVNSTCASEAALLGIPTATLGNAAYSGSGVTLECAEVPERLALLPSFKPNLQQCRSYTAAILGGHFLPYDIHGSRSCLEFENWLQACVGDKHSPTPTPEHLGGHSGVTHVDEGALIWLRDTLGVRSMVDVGCGTGGMREPATRIGITWLGIEGDPACAGSSVITHDFCSGPIDVPEHDLAWSVEFLEHVEERYMDHFMAVFRRARHVCVTHALPGKKGWHHVNCQTPDYWKKIFQANGFDFDASGTQELRARSTMKREFVRKNVLLFHQRPNTSSV